MPDFFIVGHPKCGTSALCQMLRRCPQIYFNLKEPGFFSPELRAGAAGGKRPATLEQYLALYAGAAPEQLAGDATPWYLSTPSAAGEIASLAPDARVIAILREPADFLRSLHAQHVQDHVETEADLGRALALEPERRAGRQIPPGSPRPHALLYSDYVRYVEQLRRFADVFGAEHMLVLVYDDFRADNEATLRRVLEFLGVEDPGPVEALEANPTVRVRSPRLYELVRRLSFGNGALARGARAAVKAVSTRGMRHRALALQRKLQWGAPRAGDEQLMRELRVRFRGEVVSLGDYLGRDLIGAWGYDRLD